MPVVSRGFWRSNAKDLVFSIEYHGARQERQRHCGRLGHLEVNSCRRCFRLDAGASGTQVLRDAGLFCQNSTGASMSIRCVC